MDSLAAATAYGSTRRALDAGVGVEPVELGAVLEGTAPGRVRDEDITVTCLVGLGIQDLAAVRALFGATLLDAPE